MEKIDFKKRKESKESKKSVKKKKKINISLSEILKFFLKSNKLSFLLKKDTKNLILKNYKIKTKKNIKESFNILFASDFHLDILNNSEKINELICGKKYDYVLLGGDYFDNDNSAIEKHKDLIDLLNIFREVSKTGEVYTVLGNHDCFNVANLLNNETNLLINKKIDKDCVSITGTEDFVTFKNDVIDNYSLNNEKFNILLTHSPEFIKNISNDYDLMLSGHTHGGQVKIFNLTPIKNCDDSKMVYGLWKDKITGITTSGVGCSGVPVRIGIKPEIVHIEIVKEK